MLYNPLYPVLAGKLQIVLRPKLIRVLFPKINWLQARLDVEFPSVQQPAQKQGKVNVTPLQWHFSRLGAKAGTLVGTLYSTVAVAWGAQILNGFAWLFHSHQEACWNSVLEPTWIFINSVRENRNYQQRENMKQNVPSKENSFFQGHQICYWMKSSYNHCSNVNQILAQQMWCLHSVSWPSGT